MRLNKKLYVLLGCFLTLVSCSKFPQPLPSSPQANCFSDEVLQAHYPVFSASVKGQLKELPQYSSQLNQRLHPKQETALICAIQRDQVEAAHWLIDQGADLKLTDSYQKSALFYAIEKKNLALLRSILQVPSSVEQVDNQGNTPWHFVLMHQWEQGFFELFSYASAYSLKLKNKDGKTALDVAKEKAIWEPAFAMVLKLDPESLPVFWQTIPFKHQQNLSGRYQAFIDLKNSKTTENVWKVFPSWDVLTVLGENFKWAALKKEAVEWYPMVHVESNGHGKSVYTLITENDFSHLKVNADSNDELVLMPMQDWFPEEAPPYGCYFSRSSVVKVFQPFVLFLIRFEGESSICEPFIRSILEKSYTLNFNAKWFTPNSITLRSAPNPFFIRNKGNRASYVDMVRYSGKLMGNFWTLSESLRSAKQKWTLFSIHQDVSRSPVFQEPVYMNSKKMSLKLITPWVPGCEVRDWTIQNQQGERRLGLHLELVELQENGRACESVCNTLTKQGVELRLLANANSSLGFRETVLWFNP